MKNGISQFTTSDTPCNKTSRTLIKHVFHPTNFTLHFTIPRLFLWPANGTFHHWFRLQVKKFCREVPSMYCYVYISRCKCIWRSWTWTLVNNNSNKSNMRASVRVYLGLILDTLPSDIACLVLERNVIILIMISYFYMWHRRTHILSRHLYAFL